MAKVLMPRSGALLCLISTSLSISTSFGSGECSEKEGWTVSPGSSCQNYVWCEDGRVASPEYSCPLGTLFDLERLKCFTKGEVDCEDQGGDENSEELLPQTMPQPQSQNRERPEIQNTPPTSAAPPTQTSAVSHSEHAVMIEGPPTYYADIPNTKCEDVRKKPAPDWMGANHIFTLMHECCDLNFKWLPFEKCASEGFVETNYVVFDPYAPTSSPSLSPTFSADPTTSPSQNPSYSFNPTFALSSTSPSQNPSFSFPPTISPTHYPTISPTSNPTTPPPSNHPTTSPSSSPNHRPTEAPTSPPTEAPTSPPTHAPSASPRGPTLLNVMVIPGRPNESQSQEPAQNNSHRPRPQDETPIQQTHNSDYYSFGETQQRPAITNNEQRPALNQQQYIDDYSSKDDPFSSASNESTQSHSAPVTELVFPVNEDATISEERSSFNFGSFEALAVDGDSGFQSEKYDSLLKFDLFVVGDPLSITSATLRLFALESCPSGGDFFSTEYDSWHHHDVTWDTAPETRDFIGSLGSVESNRWYEVDVTSLFNSQDEELKSTITIRISISFGGRCLFSSQEGGEATAPQLVLRVKEPTPEGAASASTMNEKQTRPPLTMASAQSMLLSAAGDFTLLRATDDATIDTMNPTVNFGMESTLLINYDKYDWSMPSILIRFDLTELQSQMPSSAVLTLFTETACESAGTFMTTWGDGSWREEDITWISFTEREGVASDSHAGGNIIGTFGGVEAMQWYGFNVDEVLKQSVQEERNHVTFHLTSGGGGPCRYSSIQSGRAPKLLVEF